MAWLKPRPQARFKIGKRYRGETGSLIAQGYSIFKQWDAEDSQYYYWEEWELTGFDNYDSWVEYDHYSKKVTLYQPIRIKEIYDVQSLKKHDTIQLTLPGQATPSQGVVTEVGSGTIARLEGKMSYQLFSDDVIHYAEVDIEPGRVISIEDYRQVVDKDYDYYAGRVLDKAEQKKLFGRVITPFNWSRLWAVFVWAFVALIFIEPIIASAIPRYETVCTPRTISAQSRYDATSTTPGASSATSPSSPSNSPPEQECRKVRVYGGGGGGVGK